MTLYATTDLFCDGCHRAFLGDAQRWRSDKNAAALRRDAAKAGWVRRNVTEAERATERFHAHVERSGRPTKHVDLCAACAARST